MAYATHVDDYRTQGMTRMGPFGTEPLPAPGEGMREHNREMLAERLHWPHEALARCREIEQKFPAYYAWWSAGTLAVEQGPGYYARLTDHWLAGGVPPTLYAPTADGLTALLAAESTPGE